MPQMVWKFVDTPVAVPATLFDMNSWASGCVLDMGDDSGKFDISPPELRKTRIANTLTDGSLNGASSFENRFLVFSLGIGPGTKAQKTATLNNLQAELYKPRNLIMYQPDSTRPPVFFRTYRSDDIKVKNRGSGIDEIWKVDCVVEAEPFAIGIRIDLSQVSVSNDPAAASGNKTFWDITGIVGDVPTPAFVRISDLGAHGTAWLATRAFNNPTTLTHFVQAEAATLGTDTTAAADAAASSVVPGTGNARTSTTFATNAGMVTRLTMTLPNASNAAALRGRYRVIARVAGITAASNVSLRWRQSNAGDFVPGPIVTVDLTPPNWRFLDLGILEFPAPQMSPEYVGWSGLQTQHATSPLGIEAQRNSGTGGLLFDWVMILPATERMCSLWQTTANAGGWICLDGENDATYGLASGSTPFGGTRILDNKMGIVTRQGGLPMLIPSITNRWYLIHNESANNTLETVDISYWPRWKEVASV